MPNWIEKCYHFICTAKLGEICVIPCNFAHKPCLQPGPASIFPEIEEFAHPS
jgi:hypothetical protein